MKLRRRKDKPITINNNNEMVLSDRQMSCLMMLASGWAQQDVADALGISRMTVCKWVKDYRAVSCKLPSIRAVQDRAKSLATSAMNTIETVMGLTHTESPTALSAAKLVLEMSGAYVPKSQHNIKTDDGNTDDSDLVAEAERLIAATGEGAAGADNSGTEKAEA